MDEIQELYHKGAVLMKSALEKYGKGDFEGGDTDRKEANKYFDAAERQVNAEGDKRTNLYGESRNFGIIYKVIEENTKGLLEDKKKRDAYSKIIRLIKENDTLKKQFNIYEALKNAENVDYPEIFVNDVINTSCNGLTKKNIIENNEKLLQLISEAKLDELIDIDDDEMDLYESIEYIITNKPKLPDMAKYSNAKGIVTEYVKQHSVKSNDGKELTESDYRKKLKDITEKYSNGITESEMELIKMVESTEDKEALFEAKKTEALDSIRESASEDESKDVIQQLSEKTYNPKTIISDIAEFCEITEIMNS